MLGLFKRICTYRLRYYTGRICVWNVIRNIMLEVRERFLGSFRAHVGYNHNTDIVCGVYLPVSAVRPRNVDELGTCTHDLVYCSHVIAATTRYTAAVLPVCTSCSPINPIYLRTSIIRRPLQPRTCGSQIYDVWVVSLLPLLLLRYTMIL